MERDVVVSRSEAAGPPCPSPLPVVLLIDSEPDVVAGVAAGPWRGLEQAFERAPVLRREFAERWGVPLAFSWQVRADLHIEEVWGDSGWAFRTYAAGIESVLAAGDTVGLHVHPIRDAQLVEDYVDEQWTLDTMTAGIDAFEAHFGAPPASVSYGRGWTTRPMLDLLSSRGVAVDISVFPGRDATLTTETVEIRADVPVLDGVPRRPYYPASPDWRKEAVRPGDGTWVLPLTSTPVDAWVHPLERAARRLVGRPMRTRVEHNYLFAVSRPGFGAYVDELVRGDRPYLTLNARSGRFGTSSLDALRRCCEALGRVHERHGVRFTDPVTLVRDITA